MTIYDIICSDPVFYTGFLFIISVPGLYVALNKNLVCPVFSSSCTYAFRAFLFCPVFGAVNLVLCLIVFTPLHFCEIAFNSPVIFFCSMMISVLLILYSLSFLPTGRDEDLLRNPENGRLFVFKPIPVYQNSKLNGTKFERLHKKRQKHQTPIERQLTDLILFYPDLEGKDMVMTMRGEIVVSENGLRILDESRISGYTTRPVVLKRKIRFFSFAKDFLPPQKLFLSDEFGVNYFQIISASILPPMSPRTNHVVKQASWKSFIPDSKIYYDASVLATANDLNQTFEDFGVLDEEMHKPIQKFWVISKKMKQLMISDFGYTEEDFLPIYLLDENGNVIDESKKENTASDGAEITAAETVSQAGKV